MGLAAMAALTFQGALGSGLEVSHDGRFAPIAENADASTGLSEIVVAHSAAGQTATFVSPVAGATVTASRFGSAGAAYGTEVAVSRDGDRWSVSLDSDDSGLTFNVAGDRSYHYWIVNYANHGLSLNSIEVEPNESDCMTAAIVLDGDAAPIYYYTINGARRTLSREMSLEYNSLTFDENSEAYIPDHVEKTLEGISGVIHVDQPLCDTSFTLSGDRFLKQWGAEQRVSSPTYSTRAVAAETSAKNLNEAADNQSSSSGATDALGGSAPAEIEFNAEVSDAVRFTEWQLSNTPDFDIIDYRFPQTNIVHTFTEYGTTYARFVCADDSGDCQFESQTYEIAIGASSLKCPNAFSPADQNGVNDEWKVSYSSLVEFECNIFNRWGVHIIKLTDPSQGWDGRHGGKFVPSGVYYYVIRARGADGKEYKLAGDINVINYRTSSGTNEKE